jgi:hypothetical protein
MKNIHVLPTDKPSRLIINWEKDLCYKSKPYLMEGTQNIYITNDEIVTEYSIGLYFIDIYNKTRHIFSPIYINKDTIAAGKFHTYINNGNMCKKIIMTTDPILILNGVQAIDDTFLEWFIKNPSCEYVDLIGLRKEKGYEFLGYEIIIPKEENHSDIDSLIGKKVIWDGKEYTIIDKHNDSDFVIIDNENNSLIGLHWDNVCIPKEEPKQCKTPLDCGKVYNEELTTQTVTCSKCGNTHTFPFGGDYYCPSPKQETLEEARKYAELSYYGDDVDVFVNGAKWQQQNSYSEEEVNNLKRNKMKQKFLKYYPFWLGIIVLIGINGYPILRQYPSIPMLFMFLIGWFRFTKIH